MGENAEEGLILDQSKEHWESVYQKKSPKEVSWFQEIPSKSLEFIELSGVGKDAKIIDVGGGASLLVYFLIKKGFANVTVLDISLKSLEESKRQLGAQAAFVKWIEADITKTDLPHQSFDFWHDRAVFHFLTNPEDRAKYITLLNQSLKPGGFFLIATFSLSGPPKCSGLDVCHYSAETLSRELGSNFKLIAQAEEKHKTPFNTVQDFVYCLFKKEK